MYRNIKIYALFFALTAFIPGVALAQFGNLMQQLQKMVPTPPSQQSTTQSTPSGVQDPKQNDLWCKQQTGSIDGMTIDTRLIKEEFKIDEIEALHDYFINAFRKTYFNKTFPSAKFFQGSFETKKVRSIYDMYLAYPEPESLAALIQISKGSDQQESADAHMALSFLHQQAPELSINKNKWWEHFQAALGSEHYTSLVFRARVNLYGEYGPKNLGQAAGDLQRAGRLNSEYSNAGGAKKEFDSQNYLLVATSTGRDLYVNEPTFQYRQQWEGPMKTILQIEQAQANYEKMLPNSSLGKKYKAASDLNIESIQIGDQIVQKSKESNVSVGQLESKKAIESSNQGGKAVYVVSSAELGRQQLQYLEVAGLDKLDSNQKDLLKNAQEKRLISQKIISDANGALLATMMSSFGDFVKMTAPLPVLRLSNETLIQSCLISAKWEQAMRAKNIPLPDTKSNVALNKSYTD
jgi:hypothetical protein